MCFARHPLTSDASISGRDDFDSERMARICHWRFAWPSSVEIVFTSITDRRGGWEPPPDSADGVACYSGPGEESAGLLAERGNVR